TLTPDARRLGIALIAFALLFLMPTTIGQIAAIGMGAILGVALCRGGASQPAETEFAPVSRGPGFAALTPLLALLFGAPVLATFTHDATLARFDAFYRSGALVLGGGHVVLPLLQDAVVAPGWISQDAFIAGYGAAQAAPGPLFTFAAYLGAAMGGLG